MRKHGPERLPVIERFFPKIKVSGYCWEWIGSVHWTGYGNFSITGKPIQRAHRVMYELAYGPIADGLFVCHTCDNRKCVRPLHLFLGTQKENMFDMMRKERFAYRSGEEARNVKLNRIQVKGIKEMLKKRIEQKKIAEKYNVSPGLISLIKSGKLWKDVK